MKKPDSESYWLGLSINNEKTILFWPDWSQNIGFKLYFYFAMDHPNEMLSKAIFFEFIG